MPPDPWPTRQGFRRESGSGRPGAQLIHRFPYPWFWLTQKGRDLWIEAKRNARWRDGDSQLPFNRIKRIHYSPADRGAIVCGAAKRGGRLRFTKIATDVTCQLCAKSLQAGADSDQAEGDPVIMAAAKKLAAKFYRRKFQELFRNLGFDLAECRGCKRQIYWVKHANGRNVPYTVDGTNHFSDCKNASLFRGAK